MRPTAGLPVRSQRIQSQSGALSVHRTPHAENVDETTAKIRTGPPGRRGGLRAVELAVPPSSQIDVLPSPCLDVLFDGKAVIGHVPELADAGIFEHLEGLGNRDSVDV
jgi:hypothetical protein